MVVGLGVMGHQPRLMLILLRRPPAIVIAAPVGPVLDSPTPHLALLPCNHHPPIID
jgi:hypothetical protein